MSALILALTAGLYAVVVVALCRAAAMADRAMERMHREDVE